MHNTQALEAKHIRQLIQRDKANRDQVNQYFVDAMTVISQHLHEFYSQYATDEGLTLAQLNQNVNQWDIQHYMQAVNTLLSNVHPDDKLNQKLQALQSKALLDKRSMWGALVSSGIQVAAFRTKNYAANELSQQYFNELDYRSPNTIIKGLNTPKQVDENQQYFNNKLSVHADTADARTQETLTAAITAGLTQASLDQLIKVTTQQDKRISNNLSSTANDLVSGIIGSLNAQAINNTTLGGRDAYDAVNQANDIHVGKRWQTQEDDKVCDLCEPLDGNIYEIDDCPVPQDDTHINCRCTTPYVNYYTGELLDVYPAA